MELELRPELENDNSNQENKNHRLNQKQRFESKSRNWNRIVNPRTKIKKSRHASSGN